MPTLKIDGQQVTVDKGTTVVDAAKSLGIEIPVFCYHPALSRPANCRMCSVEIGSEERGFRLTPSCHAEVADGMEVRTNTEPVLDARRSNLEFMLLNHPVDCPICDQAGECKLQDQYFAHSTSTSRLHYRKGHKPKAKPVGPRVILDAERCILCTRCVRFCDEVTKTGEMRVTHRGDHAEITNFPGVELDNPYSLCTVDLCPVGALTSRDFRFAARVWQTERSPGVCDRCSRGCSIHVDTLRNEVVRLVPRENPHVNQWWACDEGRLSFHLLEGTRLDEGWVTVESQRKELDAARAYKAVGEALKAAVDEHGAKAVAFLASPSWSCEDLYVLGRLHAELGGESRIYLGGRTTRGDSDDILIRADKNANRRGAERIFKAASIVARTPEHLRYDLSRGDAKFVLVLGGQHDLSEPVIEALAGAEQSAGVAAVRSAVIEGLHIAAPTRSLFERGGTFVNFQDRVQRFRRARLLRPEVHPPWRALCSVAEAAGLEVSYESLNEVFSEMAEKVPAFRGLALDAIGPHGAPARLM